MDAPSNAPEVNAKIAKIVTKRCLEKSVKEVSTSCMLLPLHFN
ncbi:hypothetical protein VCRA2126O85_360033 [Vibrio crassostreae]|nr:hypothetical protein VCRA2126O86_150085 [Vibrio crassostreae]CAK2891033.1 hypothetical protein VCRA2128O100_370033 [Vibrio crassostreae]CAK2891493.1 hypothetical protein VCRA2125O83_350026 [Vibrio crassostreae]CAK2896493.1 hypothetical protein VCRA2126O85_360033 [Vibrio crassostreae]CAK2899986.1 hypothetical protein VCRA2127O91_370032 [Vibrio crassostreae]